METALYVYAADNSALMTTTLISGLLLVLALGGVYWNSRRKVSYEQRNYRQLWGMLLGFMALLSFVALVFSWLTSQRHGEVSVYSDRLETVEATIPAKKIKRAYIFYDVPNSRYGTTAGADTTQLLIIEEYGKMNQGRNHVFSEYNYPVEQMAVEINNWLQTQKQSQ